LQVTSLKHFQHMQAICIRLAAAAATIAAAAATAPADAPLLRLPLYGTQAQYMLHT
jgi:hypothetical protein